MIRIDLPGLKISDTTTIHELSERIYPLICDQFMAAGFAKLLLTLDAQLENRLEDLLVLMAYSLNCDIIFQLGLCWMDRKGYSDLTYHELLLRLNQIHAELRKLPQVF